MSDETICFFVGDVDSFNAYCTLANVAEMVGDAFELHLVTTSEALAAKLGDRYETFGPGVRLRRLPNVRALRRYFGRETPDVVANLVGVPRYGNAIGALKPDGSTFVCRFSGENFRTVRVVEPRRKPAMFLYRNVLGRIPLYTADRFVTMGPREKKRLVDRGVDAERISILPPPVDPERFRSPSGPVPFETDHGRHTVLFLGRVSRLKGLRTLEWAIPRILDRREDLQFVLVGEREASLSVPAEYRAHVDEVGPVDPAAIPAALSAADVLVHPSLTEGISRAVLEALVSGTPVVVRDVGDMAYATNNIFTTDDELVNELRRFERLRVDDPERFTVEALADAYVSFFERVA